MKKKFIENLIMPKIQLSTIVGVLLLAVLLYYNTILTVIGLALLVMTIVYERNLAQKKKEELTQYIENLTEEMDVTVQKTIVTNPMPICIIQNQGDLIWYNRRFYDLFPETELMNINIEQLIPSVKLEKLLAAEEGESPVLVNLNERIFRLVYNGQGTQEDEDKMIVLYWVDVTSFEDLKIMYRDESPCFLYIHVDNYDELFKRAPEERKAIFASQVELKIRQFSQKHFAPVVKYDDDKYLLLMERKTLQKVREGKFSILDEVRAIETGADFPVSLSIGAGASGKTIMQNDEFALAALDLALGRGGDQAVVKDSSKIHYFGGTLQTMEKRNKGKSRIMSHAILQLIDQSSGVIIMGHKNPDMDAFGAALGVYSIVRSREKQAGIVMNFVGESLQSLVDYIHKTKEYTLLDSETALSIVDKDTLLIVVDTHIPNYTECPELLQKVEKIVVIDHHRKMEKSIENPTLAYMEPYASSTCELVAEIIQYIEEKGVIDKVEAEALLAGIALDTKHFSTRTGVRTFEAASYLRRMGADMNVVRQFFQVDQVIYKAKAQVIIDAEIMSNGIAISSCKAPDINIGLITAQAADEILDIRGMKAAIVFGMHPSGQTVISARSMGEINVQVLMEKLGGGGHLNMAGAQIDVPPDEAIKQVKSYLDELFEKKEGK